MQAITGKKEYLARFLYRSGLLALGDRLRFGERDRLTILGYHRICHIEEETGFPFDLDLISGSPEQFRWQMEYVRRHWTPITFDPVLAAIDERALLPRRALIVTFDDGFDDNYHYAFPILRELGIPATFFVATDYIDAASTFWFDRLAHLVYRAPHGVFALPELGLRLPLSDVPSRRLAADRVLAVFKAIGDSERRAWLDTIEARYGKYADPQAAALSAPLTSVQIREMSRAGMEFGSHSASHPILAALEPAQLRRELIDSRAALETLTGKPVRVLSYPNGLAPDINDAVMQTAKEAGYRLGLSYLHGKNRLARLDAFRVRRQPVERYLSRPYFVARLNLPGIF